MPGDDADFAAYLAARWPALVRTLVLLGCARGEAGEVAQTAVARCYRDWERVRRGDDVDAYVYGTVVARLHRHRRRVPAPPAPTLSDPSDDELLRQALMVQLDALDPDEREAVVLRWVAELDEAQVADVLDVPVESAQARITHGLGRIDLAALRDLLPTGQEGVSEIFRRSGESVEVLTVPVEEVVAEARAQQRRRRRTVLAVVAAAAVVVGGLTWVGNRDPAEPPEADLPPAPVVRERNPVQLAWYANGRLHLEKVSVAVSGLTDLVELNGGAVYGDREGTIAFVAADGERRRIGSKDPGSPLVSSTGEGWAAWIEGSTLRVYDVSAGRELASRPVSDDARVIAIDQHRVYYEDAGSTYASVPELPEAVREERNGLVDVESANRVYQLGGSIDMVQSFFNVSFQRPGTGGLISPGGVLVLSRASGPGVAEGRPFRPLLYDARSGARLPTGVGVGERAVDAAFSRNNTIVYFVARVADLEGGSDLDGNLDPLLVLRSCDASSARCTDLAPVQSGTDRPVLAH